MLRKAWHLAFALAAVVLGSSFAMAQGDDDDGGLPAWLGPDDGRGHGGDGRHMRDGDGRHFRDRDGDRDGRHFRDRDRDKDDDDDGFGHGFRVRHGFGFRHRGFDRDDLASLILLRGLGYGGLGYGGLYGLGYGGYNPYGYGYGYSSRSFVDRDIVGYTADGDLIVRECFSGGPYGFHHGLYGGNRCRLVVRG